MSRAHQYAPLNERQAYNIPPQSIINYKAGAMFDKVQPYRVVVRVGGTPGGLALPPACFFVAAIRALRADKGERVLILAGNGLSKLVNDIVSQLGKVEYDGVTVAHGGAEVWEDGEQHLHLNDTLLSALRVVWGDPNSQLPEPPLRMLPRGQLENIKAKKRQAYEVVWTWCNNRHHTERSNNETACAWLSEQTCDFQVQVKHHRTGPWHAHPTKHLKGIWEDRSRSNCSLAARSTWKRHVWQSLQTLMSRPYSGPQPVPLLRGEWLRENVCIGYSPARPDRNSDRFNSLVQASSTNGQLLWPLPWPDMYAEYKPGFLRLDSETRDHHLTRLVNLSSPLSPLGHCTWQSDASTAFLTELTMDNLYHALIHALPTVEFYQRLKASLGAETVHILPHFTQYWPGGNAIGASPPSLSQTVGWKLLAHALGVPTHEWGSFAARAQLLTSPGECHCYRRLFGGHSAFMPPPHMKAHQVLGRVNLFASALTATLKIPVTIPSRTHRRILFEVRRNGARQIVNEVEVRSAVAKDPVLSMMVEFITMESLPVVQQHALVSSSVALAGMHGMGLAWSMLLPPNERGRSSCLEITGEWKTFARLDYYGMSQANGVHYVRLIQPNAIHTSQRCNYRKCGNITANATQVLEALQYMAARAERGNGRQGGCARHPPLPLITKFGTLNSVDKGCLTLDEHRKMNFQ